ncbi:proline oxidase PrnD [Cordyceps militaris CM01]|uniref:Proline dehydrogenase n=1 Tax=Cordyceps militaris (strain CM01) TaxID=983644 RepID=G3JC56_CORMM|nr:proline oxidase PrnD [Cordyceps militaris CM01]EGX94571.1 proline oxidase PrnD [Cordyceps militaris CM01]
MPSAPARGLACLPLHRALPSVVSSVRVLSPACVGFNHRSRLSANIQRRSIHNSERMAISSSDRRTNTLAELPAVDPTTQPPSSEPKSAPLSVLPLAMILRSLLTTVVSSSPFLLPPSLRIMSLLANTQNPILNPDKNPLLRFFLKKTFYAQFCAGEKPAEVQATVARLKNIGFSGVILGYAKEVVLTEDQAKAVAAVDQGKETAADIANEIDPWALGTLETVTLAEPGDYVALKFTGAGRLALYQLSQNSEPSPYLYKSIDAICALAQQRGVRLLFDAEQDALQDGIDNWTMTFARKYNTSPETATVYGTYQTYKKKTPAVISRHLAEAKEGGFSLGVKLVRGAYLNSDPRHCFWESQEGTDACFNSIAAGVLTRQWGPMIEGKGEFPDAHVVLATHNVESVRRARAICDAGGAKSGVAFAQLQGMADEVSCELVEAGNANRASDLPVFKYLVWGSTGECMKYLLRRANENKDAVGRTRSGRDAMWAELVRRCKATFSLA